MTLKFVALSKKKKEMLPGNHVMLMIITTVEICGAVKKKKGNATRQSCNVDDYNNSD